MIVSQTVCDRCGAQKKDTNHWFKVDKGQNLFFLWMGDPESVRNRVNDTGRLLLDLCSESCVLKALSEFMGKAPCDTESSTSSSAG
jgi:hypothetical protein